MCATPLRTHARLFRGALSVSAGVLFAAVLLGAGRLDAAPSTPGGTIRALPITAALRTAIRASFYHAYRADPRGFSATAGLPSSAVLELGLNDAAVLAGTTPAESSAWVIGAVCMLTPVACEDAGAFQVFYRTALTKSFVYLPGGLCDLPAPLASRWFPGGHYPLGIACPAGNVLVRRGGVRSGAWAALVPRAWTRVPYGAVHFGRCSTLAVPKLNPSLCSSEGGDTDIDVWFDPAKTKERLTVITCRGGGCFPPTTAFSPRLVAPPGATVSSRHGGWELAYSERPGTAKLSRASEEVTTLLLATHSNGNVSYPVYTVSVELPPSQSNLALAIVDTFATP
jgi:hypothetical protein